jgi:hypothetical protein
VSKNYYVWNNNVVLYFIKKEVKQMDKIVVKTPHLRILAIVCILFSILCTVGSIYGEQAYLSLIFIFFVMLGIIMLLLTGSAEISSIGFKVILPIGKYYIPWTEVDYVEIGQGNLILGNQEKRISFPSFEFWRGRDKDAAYDIIDKILEQRNIDIQETKRAILPIYKNTRI